MSNNNTHDKLFKFQNFLLQNSNTQQFNFIYQEIIGDLFNDILSETITHCVS